MRFNRDQSLEQSIRVAMKKGHLQVWFQPKFFANSGLLSGAEALLRWQDPVKGQISPATFIPLAEKTDLIHEIGTWVLRSAVQQLRAWDVAGFDLPNLAVNVSPRQLGRNDFCDEVARCLDEHHVAAERLTLELTESQGDVDPEMADRLAPLGLTLALDDFGTGYSSLCRLQTLPATQIKIAAELVRPIVTDLRSARIVARLVSLGHELGMRVVAEGVESQEQLSFLQSTGCDEIQGFLFSRALPSAEFAAAWLDHVEAGMETAVFREGLPTRHETAAFVLPAECTPADALSGTTSGISMPFPAGVESKNWKKRSPLSSGRDPMYPN